MGKVRLVFSFKRLHQGVWGLHQQKNMTEFRARSRSTRAILFHVVLLVALLWLCGSPACEKGDKSSRKCAGKKYFLSEDLARAAQLQVGSTVCPVHWDEIRRSNDRCRFQTNNPRPCNCNKLLSTYLFCICGPLLFHLRLLIHNKKLKHRRRTTKLI